MEGPPKTILLATDLSARCDRALDRALSLSQLWQAKLVILHVLENPPPTDSDPGALSWRRVLNPADVAKKQLLADIGSAVETADVVLEEGDAADAIVRTAETRGCDLIVIGIARDELLGRFVLGTTVDRLLRRSQVPVLVVRSRARAPYRHIAVATDFSEPSRHALEAAVRFFSGERLTVFHAYDAPASPFASNTAADQRHYRQLAEQEYETFLKTVKSGEAIRQRSRTFIEFGTPAHVLREAVRDMNVDLVVLGTQGRSALAEALIGSVAKQILAEVLCDALLVRGPRAEPAG